MRALVAANLAVRAALEVCALVALAYWGFTRGSGPTAWILGLAAPVALAVLWGLFVAPKAMVELPPPARFAIELTLFAGVALALAATGATALGALFALVALVSGTLNHLTR